MRGKILVVDDDANVRDVLSVFFEGIGFSVEQANNGMSVLPLVRVQKPDLIVCDLVMPGLSGIQVLKQVRAEFPNQRFIMMSGLQEEDFVDEALELGAQDCMTKPVSLENLENNFINKIFPPE